MGRALDLYRSRQFRVVTINGEQFTIRSPTMGELQRIDLVGVSHRTALYIAFALLERDHSQAFLRGDSESDSEFAARVALALEDVPSLTLRALREAITKLATPPPIETMLKNFAETTNFAIVFVVSETTALRQIGSRSTIPRRLTNGRCCAWRSSSSHLAISAPTIAKPETQSKLSPATRQKCRKSWSTNSIAI